MTTDDPAVDLATLTTLESEIGDRGFVLDTVEVYLGELPGRVAGIDAGLAAGDSGQVKSVAHSLKSSSAMLGAMRLSALCAALEQEAAAGAGFADADGSRDALHREADAAEAGLRAYLAS